MQLIHHSSAVRNSPITRLNRPFLRFLEIESAGGIVLLICTILALILANSPVATGYSAFWHVPISLNIADFHINNSLEQWINDGLMTIFFFVVGLEIKRELIDGELKVLKAAILPIMAALGGMIIPAIIYSLILQGESGSQGWGIPMATDIAFVVGFMALLGKRLPHGLKIFVLSLAIVDDIGAVIIIAIFYSSDISFQALSLGLLGFGIIAGLNRVGVRRVPVYIFVGIMIWIAFFFSGIHPTVAGVLLGLLTPASAWVGDTTLSEAFSSWQNRKNARKQSQRMVADDIKGLIFLARETVSPLERLEIVLHPWVAFFIMPLFALANAGIPFALDAFNSRISYGVISGLFFGKVSGILLFSFIAVKFIGCRLPTGTKWSVIIGAGFLAGVGFTMSIFIASLALDGGELIEAKAGILLGSSISTIVGLGILYLTLPRKLSVTP